MEVLDKKNLEVLDRIKQLLKEQKKKQVDLTSYLGISGNAFTNWKNGDNTSYKKHLPEIAEFLGVSVDFLLGKESSNDFTYALYEEITHDLSQEQIDQLKKYADFLRSN